jgi:hypothetical protein
VRFVTEPIGEMRFSIKISDLQQERNAASVIVFFRMFKIDCTFHSSAAEADLLTDLLCSCFQEIEEGLRAFLFFLR